jgi:outer membrane protein OmpA-like peptidoglycan-associated protein
VFVVSCLLFLNAQHAEAQFLNKLVKHAEEKIETEAQKRAERRVDNKIDEGFDQVEGAIDGEQKQGESKTLGSDTINDEISGNKIGEKEQGVDEQELSPKVTATNVVWSKFDFVPGDEVIFEDLPASEEENGEFPSRWDYINGSAEIGELNGEAVILFLDGGGSIIPYLKNSEEDYLPDVFTVEFDVYFETGNHSKRYWLSFRDQKNQRYKGLGERLTIYVNGLSFLETDKRYPGTENLNWGNNPEGGWKHISIAYTKGKFKAYMDDTRLINIPHLEGNPWGITLEAGDGNMFVKNIRIAKGGVKYYDRVLSDGKIIVNGIRFDVNKASIKPESAGAINKIYQLMLKQADLKFSVEGHTDSDGDEELNLQLSKDRAESIMERLISMGIDAARLKFTGWGEGKPIADNATSEGKANNRRVEFVKFK